MPVGQDADQRAIRERVAGGDEARRRDAEARCSGGERAFIGRDDDAALELQRYLAPVLLERPAPRPQRPGDDGVRIQIRRDLRPAGAAQVSRRRDQHARDAAQPARGGVRIGERTETESDVHPLRDQRLALIVDEQHDAQLRVALEELVEPRDQPMHGKARRGSDSHDAAQLSGAARRVIGLLQRRQRRLDARQVLGAGFGQRERARAAGEERGADFPFQRRDDARRRGLRQAELAPGAREAAGARHAHEEPQRGQAVTHGIPDSFTARIYVSPARRLLAGRGMPHIGLRKEKQMNNSVVLVTGALTGIGRATALAFARDGARVVVSGRRDEEGRALAAEIRRLDAEAEFVHADVRLEGDIRRLVDRAVERFGRLDIAVNNAGTEGKFGPLTDETADNYTATFETNVLGTLLSLKHELRVMAKQGAGSIVNLSSIAGHVGMPGAAVYVASKHAIEGLTKSAALEGAAAGVRVNAVAPGPVATAMLDRATGGCEDVKAGFLATVPAKRAASVEEIAQTIVFVASDKSKYLTGQIITVDGGYTAQ